MMPRVVLVVLGTVPLVSTHLRAQTAADSDVTISTDRPAVTNSSVVVPRGALQVENGFLATDTEGRYVLDFPESYLRYGLLDKTELRFIAPDYFQGTSPQRALSGFGDAAIGVKEQLGPLRGFDLSGIIFLSLPTGAKDASSHGYDPGVQFPWSRSLPMNWTVAGQVAFYWPTLSGKRNFTSETTLLFDRQLTQPWDAFIEYAVDSLQRGGSSQLLHVGTAYKLAPHHQIDFHAAVGLSDAAPRSFFGIGYSFLYFPN
jgi:hypothetical protein